MLSFGRIGSLLVLGGLLAAVISPFNLIRADEEGVIGKRNLFEEGISLYEQGLLKEAYLKFNEFLSKNPSNKLALEMRDEAGYGFFVRALAEKDHNFVVTMRKILERAALGEKIRRIDDDRIKDLLQKIRDYGKDDSKFVEKYRIMVLITQTVGQWVTPFCVEALGNQQADEFRTDIIHLLYKLGEDVTLPVIEMLNSPNEIVRQNAVIVLGHIGDWRALPALQAVYQNRRSPLWTLQQNQAAHGLIKLPMGENGAQVMREESRYAINKVTAGKLPEDLPDAPDLYYALAYRYYLDDLAVVLSNYEDWVYWYWSPKDDKLKYRIVERFEYNELLAEECCYDGLALRPNDVKLKTLLVCTLYAQRQEVLSALLVIDELEQAGAGYDTALKELLESRSRFLERCKTLNYAAGKELLYHALSQSILRDRNVLVAVACIHALRDLRVSGELLPSYGGGIRSRTPTKKSGSGKRRPSRRKGPARAAPAGPALGAALTAALLDSEDKRIRYAAAECLTVINPKKRFDKHELVVQTLIDALGEYSYRVVLIIEKDLQARNHLVGVVRDHLKMMPIVATSGYDGFSRIQAFPTEDLVIIATDLTKKPVLGPEPEDADVYDKDMNRPIRHEDMDWKAYEFIDRLHNSRRTAHVPVIVSAVEDELHTIENLYVPDRAHAAIAKLVDPEELRTKVEKIFASDEARYQRDAKARKDRQAAIAATCFAKHIDLNNPNFDVRDAIGPLVRAAHRPVYEVRIPALQGLGRIGRDGRFDADIRPIALTRLRELFGDKDVDYRVRAAAADAIGSIIQPSGRMDPSIYLILVEGMADSHMEVRRAAAKAIGKANLPQIEKDDRTKVFFLHRVHKPIESLEGD
ncbi:MAG: hypothetical protein E3J72_14120 [Planctomycetota bacterium]|nr:MAG: hypothetical protein E3J72_14120 [Planctomycetota bacterium]